jgi:hypothetical protein
VHRTHDQIAVPGEESVRLPVKRIARVGTYVSVGMKSVLIADDKAGMPLVLRAEAESTCIDRFEFVEAADDKTTFAGHAMMAAPGFPGDRIP